MAIISKRTGARIPDGETIVTNDSSGEKILIIQSVETGFRVLNRHNAQDHIPDHEFTGGDIKTPYLRVQHKPGFTDTLYPVKER